MNIDITVAVLRSQYRIITVEQRSDDITAPRTLPLTAAGQEAVMKVNDDVDLVFVFDSKLFIAKLFRGAPNKKTYFLGDFSQMWGTLLREAIICQIKDFCEITS